MGEYPDWGLDHSLCRLHFTACCPNGLRELERDFNHPSIIGWCPHNETWDQNGRKQFDEGVRLIYRVTKGGRSHPALYRYERELRGDRYFRRARL